MERYGTRYLEQAQCDVCGEWGRELIDLEAEVFCGRCEYQINQVLICKNCLQGALAKIKEGNECEN